ncbi:MAG: LysR family transcriptional regulator [Verrucomicrobia bacterium]|nr:LysR family transcriptional regulator [Kiritimatiellia bacterium]MCP5487920.1 LysR family transcriptional regulator [Verrucomicrobiota bacterium]
MSFLNYHHLRYFHAIVREGTLTAAAKRMGISQSAMSVQLKELENSLGCALFSREHKSLHLTEEGRMVYDFAETIFRTGDELQSTLQRSQARFNRALRVGCVATLSRNFILGFLRDELMDNASEVVIHSGSLAELLTQLQDHTLDLVLSNRRVKTDAANRLECREVAEQPVSLVGPPRLRLRKKGFRFPEDLAEIPLVLPSRESGIRKRFDELLNRHPGIQMLIAAEADDMAMLRLLAREMNALALLPPVVVYDELEAGILREVYRVPELRETFFATTGKRRYPNPLVEKLLRA